MSACHVLFARTQGLQPAAIKKHQMKKYPKKHTIGKTIRSCLQKRCSSVPPEIYVPPSLHAKALLYAFSNVLFGVLAF